MAQQTLGRISLDEWSAWRRGLYLTTHPDKRQTPMSPAGFEPTIPGSERSQTHGSVKIPLLIIQSSDQSMSFYVVETNNSVNILIVR